MKKLLWMMALGMCLVAAGCSKSDDGLDIDKTYAEDDFVMNERNIKEKLVGECASRVNNALRHQPFEPGTKEAFDGYVACLHQLYLKGAAIQLKRMGYHMTKLN